MANREELTSRIISITVDTLAIAGFNRVALEALGDDVLLFDKLYGLLYDEENEEAFFNAARISGFDIDALCAE